ncbi:hypothetical protein, partial [Mesorhizobium sp. M4B.F.Ca.ET.169.01.1.1]|uniref:hypothetical protein n=1 Tax=Mesorhizobium sp. M4B.F.Ca.ET.169.01.1.1 TaxID=2563949 RepID=UPI001AED53A0
HDQAQQIECDKCHDWSNRNTDKAAHMPQATEARACGKGAERGAWATPNKYGRAGNSLPILKPCRDDFGDYVFACPNPFPRHRHRCYRNPLMRLMQILAGKNWHRNWHRT